MSAVPQFPSRFGFQAKFVILPLFKKLLDEEQGFVATSELILISTIVCLAMVVGLTEVSQAMSKELIDVANARQPPQSRVGLE